MKKSSCLIKAFLISLIFLCFISCGDNSVMYQLTLDGNGATTHNMTRVYYNATNGKWYSEVGIASPTTRVTVPQRQFTLKYDFNGETVTNNVPLVSTAKYAFSSYPGYTDSQGNILSSVVLNSNAITSAEWKSAGENGFVITLPEVAPEAVGKEFKGWKKYNGDNYTYAPGSSVTISENEIVDSSFTMIADWQVSNDVRLVVKKDAADTGKVYTYKSDERKWYSQENNIVTSVPVPEKKISVTFLTNRSNISSVPGGVIQYSTFPFNGYIDITNNKTYINQAGSFSTISGNDRGKTIDVIATWGEQQPIVLPSLEKSGFVFLGWNFSGIDAERYDEPGFEYKPAESSEGVTLKGVWRSNDIKELVLDSNDATTPAVEKIYYRIGDKWYRDSSGSDAIDDIDVPKKVWTITYDSNVEDGESIPIPESKTEIEFEGFIDETTGEFAILKDGRISTNYKISDDGGAIANWKYIPVDNAQGGVSNETTTLKINAPKNVVREDFTLLGWDEDKDATDPTYTDTITYKNNDMTLYAIWRDDRVWKLTVNNVQSKNTSDMTSKNYYYKLGDKKWYRTSDANASPIEKIDEDDMKRTYKVYFESNMDNVQDAESKDYEYTFGGAEITSGEDGEGNVIEIISADGTLNELPSDNLIATVKWSESGTWSDGQDANVSKDDIPLSDVAGYTHLGWSLTQNGEIIETLPPLTKNTTLYAIWQNDNVYRLTLDANGATVPSSGEVFYKVSDKKWYSQETCAPEEEITKITIPEKVWTANFDLNYLSSPNNPESLMSAWTFEGYSPYIDRNGNFTTVGLDTSRVVKAMWGGQQSIQMPTVARDHYIFMGWNKSGAEGVNADPSITGSYMIKVDDLEGGTSSVLFKAIWKSEVYKLTLEDNGATTPSSGSVYYVYDKGWFSDEKGTTPIEKLPVIPTKVYSVQFKPYLGSSTLYNLKSELPFNGYNGKSEDGTTEITYIENDGNITQTLTSSIVVNANWGEPSEVVIPQQAKREGYIFDKWVRNDDIIETPYRPKENAEVIEGIWIDAYAFNDEAFVFENDGYVFDPSQIDDIAGERNYVIPSTYDNRISVSSNNSDISNDVASGVYKVKGFKEGAKFKKEGNESLLTSINIPSTITEIPHDLFNGCDHLTTVVLPASCTLIGDNAFLGCTNLQKIEFGGDKAAWDKINKGGGWNSGTGTIEVLFSDKTKIQVMENTANNTLAEGNEPELS